MFGDYDVFPSEMDIDRLICAKCDPSVNCVACPIQAAYRAIKTPNNRVHWTLRLQAWLKNLIGLGLRQ